MTVQKINQLKYKEFHLTPTYNTCCMYIHPVIFPKTYPLFLTGNKGLKTRRNSEPQLVNEGWLILGVDLNFDPCFERGLIW